MITTIQTINFAEQITPPVIPVIQGDTGRNIQFEIADYTIPEGATATYYIQKPSGNAVYNTASISGNHIVVELTAQAIAETGSNHMQVRLALNDEIITSFDILLLVYPFRGVDAIESLTEMNVFDKAVEQAEEAIDGYADTQKDAIEAKGQEVIESIPADYTELSNEVTDLKADLNQKANIDGSYESMTVGNAEQLLSTTYTEDSVPYLYRTSGGSADIGDREEDVIVGGSVVWNQFAQNSDFSTSSNWGGTGTFAINDGVATSTNTKPRIYQGFSSAKPTTGHKCLFLAECKFTAASDSYRIGVASGNTGGTNSALIDVGASDLNKWITVGRIIEALVNTTMFVGLISQSTVEFANDETLSVKSFCCFDLTQMFGSTVADTIYSAEQASAGAGVAMFRSLFPKTYYAYDAGTLKSVEGLTAHKMVGFNQWDEEWEVGGIGGDGSPVTDRTKIRSKNFIPVFPEVTYYCVTPNPATYVLFFDRSKTAIGNFVDVANKTFTVPADAAYCKLRVGNNSYPITTYNNDICINLSWSGYRNGEYEAYKEYEYPLDSTLTLRGIPKVDASGNLYYDGDRYLPDGTVERRYGVVDLGTLTWTYRTDTTVPIFQADINNAQSSQLSTIVGNIVCNKYIAVSSNNVSQVGYDKTVAKAAIIRRLYIQDTAYTDADTFKTAMSGVLLVYELATPTTETADPYQEVQIVNDFGTEEYVIDSQIAVPVPVGHETKYLVNLRDKLQHLPDLASADGYYLIQQVGHKMELVHFRIPQAPSADGTYTLKATVSGGTPTYTWEAVE